MASGARRRSKVKRVPFTGRDATGRDPAYFRLAVLHTLLEAGALSEDTAIAVSEIRRVTGLDDDIIGRIASSLVAVGFAVLPYKDIDERRLLARRLYVEVDPEQIRNAERSLRTQAMHRIGRADLLGRTAAAVEKSVPVWIA